MGTEGGKRLSELRVCDLKLELEKRSLETTGVKMELVKRLQEVSEFSSARLNLILCLTLAFQSKRCIDAKFGYFSSIVFVPHRLMCVKK